MEETIWGYDGGGGEGVGLMKEMTATKKWSVEQSLV